MTRAGRLMALSEILRVLGPRPSWLRPLKRCRWNRQKRDLLYMARFVFKSGGGCIEGFEPTPRELTRFAQHVEHDS